MIDAQALADKVDRGFEDFLKQARIEGRRFADILREHGYEYADDLCFVTKNRQHQQCSGGK